MIDNDAPLRVGDVLYGYCGGFFGRDSYENKRIEAIGSDWVVCRDSRGEVYVATFNDISWSVDSLKEYRNPPEDDNG